MDPLGPTPRLHARTALAAVLLVLAAPAGWAQGAASAPAGSDALARCERAIRQALMPQAGPAAELRLSATPPRSPSVGSPTLLQGEGQWRDGATLRKFRFSCNIDPQDSEAVGVVVRQESPPLAAQADAETDRGPRPQPSVAVGLRVRRGAGAAAALAAGVADQLRPRDPQPDPAKCVARRTARPGPRAAGTGIPGVRALRLRLHHRPARWPRDRDAAERLNAETCSRRCACPAP